VAFLAVGLCFASVTLAAEMSAVERYKIEYLLSSIESLKDAQFIRNGAAYDAITAAAHLRVKLRSAGSRVETAEDFIRLCASVSSVSGVPYQIRFADGRLISAEIFLRQKLAELPTADPSSRAAPISVH
jgi:hypothetical protein